MAGFIKLEVKKFEVAPINMKIESKIFEAFQRKCKERNLQMCTVIETFCQQYANGKYELKEYDILKWKDKNFETSVLSTPINKNIYCQFKDKVKSNKYFMKHVLSAFIEDYAEKDLILEFVNIDKLNKEAD